MTLQTCFLPLDEVSALLSFISVSLDRSGGKIRLSPFILLSLISLDLYTPRRGEAHFIPLSFNWRNKNILVLEERKRRLGNSVVEFMSLISKCLSENICFSQMKTK